ncbi:MAG: ice-binding family protein, partial [Bacteroidia bacterium]
YFDGATGSKGDKGETGLNGTNGTKGDKGDTGTTGGQGIQGVIGVTGLTGTFNSNFTGDVIGEQFTTIVEGINGTSLASLATGILKNTTSTGIPSIAIASDFPQLNQSTTGNAANVSGIILPTHGGTGIANNNLATLTLPGEFPATLTTTGTTSVTLPTSGKLATEAYVLANSGPSLSYTVSAGAEINTTSTSDVVIPGMTYSPPIAGKYIVNFNSQFTLLAVQNTLQASSDLKNGYLTLMAKANTNISRGVAFVDGETITKGVYSLAGGACSAAGIITLDAKDDPNAEFIFKCSAAYSIASSTSIILINGASANNVYWIAEGAITLGALSKWQGTMLSNNGAVAMGNQSSITGRLFTNNGAITLNASTISLPSDISHYFGTFNDFAAFTSIGAVANTGNSSVTGDVGTNAGAITGFETSTKIGNQYQGGASLATTTAAFSIYQNGLQIQFSERSRSSNRNGEDINLQGTAEIAAGEAIDIRWHINTGTVKLQNRTLTLIQVR